MFSVMLGTLCRVPGCVNMTSVNVYPFCYEHLDFHADYTGQVRQEFFEQDKSEKFSGTHQEKENHQVHTRPTKVDASTMTEGIFFFYLFFYICYISLNSIHFCLEEIAFQVRLIMFEHIKIHISACFSIDKICVNESSKLNLYQNSEEKLRLRGFVF